MEWKVSKEKIKISAHSNADSLEIGKVGSYQVVVQKGQYKDGDEVIFAPEKSILSGKIKEEFSQYLVGKNKDRVKAVRLRGEISSGVIIPNNIIPDFESFELGEDVSVELGIKKYEPPIPSQLMGKVKPFSIPFIGNHDCQHASVYINDLKRGERVVITEKVHGSQFILAHDIENEETIVSSKGLLKSGLTIQESESNAYWIAAKNDSIVDRIIQNFNSGVVQVFGEVIPVQKGYSYGQTKETVRLFDVRLNGVSIPYDKVPNEFKELWVPVIYDGPLDLLHKEVLLYEDKEKGIRNVRVDNILPKSVIKFSKGNELVSGKNVHIREGAVIRPYVDRNAHDGTPLRLKLINPKYKETGDEIS